MWVDMWNAQRNARVETDHTPDNDEEAYLRHLEWLRKEYRVIHKGAWTRADCLDVLPSEAADGAFNNSIRETIGAHLDYGPLHDRVVCLSFVSFLKYEHVSFLREWCVTYVLFRARSYGDVSMIVMWCLAVHLVQKRTGLLGVLYRLEAFVI
jgi:hypothetical protein